MKLIQNIKLVKNKLFKIAVSFYICLFLLITATFSNEINNEKFIQIQILDKVSSKNYKLEIEIGKEKSFKNLLIKAFKCKNSEFDDNPEITAYLQVKDISIKSKDGVFVFNGWMFFSSPTLSPFDHPVYDIWLTRCY